MFSVTFDFECTFITEVQIHCSLHRSAHSFTIAITSHNHKEQIVPQFFFQFFSRIQTEYGEILIWRDTHFQSECWKKACNFVIKRVQHGVFFVNIAKFLRTAFSPEPVALSKSRGVFTNQSNIYVGAFLQK